MCVRAGCCREMRFCYITSQRETVLNMQREQIAECEKHGIRVAAYALQLVHNRCENYAFGVSAVRHV